MQLPVSEIARLVGGEIVGRGDPIIRGVAAFEEAGPDQITFVASAAYRKRIAETGAGAVIVAPDAAEPEKVLVRVRNPSLALAKVVSLFHPVHRMAPGMSQDVYVGEHFKCGRDVSVSPGVFIGDRVSIGDRVVLHPGVTVATEAVLGDDVVVYPNVSILERCLVGSRVTIHAGSVIGSDGFGYAFDGGRYHKIPQTGIVKIDDDVEIGACNTIDRATFGATWIKRGVKTDNLVHIAHNVVVGEDTVLVAQVGIAGSVTIGDHAVLAGQAGITGHITIGNGATVGPQCGVARSVADGEVVSGSPEMPHRLWLKVSSIIRRLPEMKRKIRDLEKRVADLEKALAP